MSGKKTHNLIKNKLKNIWSIQNNFVPLHQKTKGDKNMIVERNDYFKLVREGKVSDVNDIYTEAEETIHDLACVLANTIKKQMVAVCNITKAEKFVLSNTKFLKLEYSCGIVYLVDDDGATDIDELNDIDTLLTILGYLV